MSEIQRGQSPKGNELLDLYIRIISVGKSPRTVEAYRQQLIKTVQYIERRLERTFDEEAARLVDGRLLAEYFLTMSNLSPATRNLYVIIVRGFFDYLYEGNIIDRKVTGLLKRTPVRDYDKKESKADVPCRTYTKAEIESLLYESKGRNKVRNRAIIALLLSTGLRASELCSLNVEDWRGEGMMEGGDSTIRCLRKGGRYADVLVGDWCKPLMAEYLETRPSCRPESPLFITSNGRRMERKNLWKVLSTMQRSVNVATGVHNFRHTVISEAAKKGGAAVARDVANQKDLIVTNRYIHSTQEEQLETLNNFSWTDI